MAGPDDALRMKVAARRDLTGSIVEFTLKPVDPGKLPEYEAGAHVTVQTPCGAMRRYSLIGPGGNGDEYVIAVKREPDSRGGSLSMHEQAQIGAEFLVEPPQNSFALRDGGAYLLIAGGIGVTPILAMARQLAAAGKEFSVIYCSRSAEEAAYLDEMRSEFGDLLLAHHDGGDPGRVFDFWDYFAEPKNMLVYCCGPKPLMEEIDAISGHWPEGRVVFEDFKPAEVVRPDDEAFEVELAKSGAVVTVPADRSILEALRDSGFPVRSSCESGACGTCKTRLLEGEPDHRDLVLMDDERKDRIMICVSRACNGRLVLDL
jgi:phthalate 4,5-dioxygenase reductase component